MNGENVGAAPSVSCSVAGVSPPTGPPVEVTTL